ncbi:hypothetical protein DOTSEDRAFT_74312 [Dothistroma septosporum NZE10]|uniref:Uncharacterized protein n=1 Tax=Dothistroma septosporum (strain NZE10 / CBS 128990) TaxID=675120 RepID=N1PHG5_DOTSN|nr:hypothetical protein DOTSEDRAFT_74312 [Dothistroma septosporum NZE10]
MRRHFGWGAEFFRGPLDSLVCRDYASTQSAANEAEGQADVKFYNTCYICIRVTSHLGHGVRHATVRWTRDSMRLTLMGPREGASMILSRV